MKLVTDLKEIERLGNERWEENLAFRSFLKGVAPSRSKLDGLVRKLAKKVSARIDCESCRNCCIAVHPVFNPQERRKIATHLGLTLTELERKFGMLSPAIDSLFGFNHANSEAACPFFREGKCSIEAVRPTECSTFPHLTQNNFLERLLAVVENYSVCPIVFNVYEQLKQHFHWEYDKNEDISF